MLKKFLSEKKFTLLSIFLLILITFISYSNSFQAEFVFDDFYSIARNANIKNLNLTKIYQWSPTRFLTNLTFALNYHFSGLYSSVYHQTNFFIHLVNVIIVYFLINLIIKLGNIFQKNHFMKNAFPLSVALIFAVHPIQTQAVTYISQCYTILASLFYLLTLCFYLKSIQNAPLFLQLLFV